MIANDKCFVTPCGKDAPITVSEVSERRLVSERGTCRDHRRDFMISHYSRLSGRPTALPTRPAVLHGASEMIAAKLDLLLFDIESQEGQVHILQIEGRGALVIRLGVFEVANLHHLVKGTTVSRPLTHETMASLIATLGAKLQQVEIDHLDGSGQFYTAKLRIMQGEQVIGVDARPSDALGLAICAGVPILVAKDLFTLWPPEGKENVIV